MIIASYVVALEDVNIRERITVTIENRLDRFDFNDGGRRYLKSFRVNCPTLPMSQLPEWNALDPEWTGAILHWES